MRGHGIAGAPTPAVGARDAADDDDAPVSLRFRRGIGVIPSLLFEDHLPHCRGRMFQREKGGEGVSLEALLQVIGRGGVDGGRAQEPRRADPDVEASEGVEDLVDQGEGLVFFGYVEGVGDYFCVGVGLGE